jgi:hypothetical protein
MAHNAIQRLVKKEKKNLITYKEAIIFFGPRGHHVLYNL